MEGKAALFKRFAGIDAWPLCLDTQDPDEIVEIVRAIAPGFAGINLEDISAPRCFEIEARLRELLDIPVFHDDQHGTAIVVLAALTNALRVVGKKIDEVRVVMSGAGAAGTAILRLLLAAGVRDVVVADVEGVIHRDRPGLHESLVWLAEATNRPSCRAASRTRSPAPTSSSASRRPTCSTARTWPRWPTTRSSSRWPTRCPRSTRGRPASTPRSWPPAGRTTPTRSTTCWRSRASSAACSTRPHQIDDDLLVAAADAIASAVSDDELNANYIIPSVFHAEVHHSAVASRRRGTPRERHGPRRR